MPLPSNNRPILRPSIREEVYDTLLSWIMDGVLKPGEKILDKDLASHLGVSRTPVREALRRLEDKHLVESAANRWTRISPILPEEPHMIYPVILCLEQLALSQAAHGITDQDLDKMMKANAMFAKALKKKDPVTASRLDKQFHEIFIQRSGNGHLIRILEDLKIRCLRLEIHFFRETGPGNSWAHTSSVEEHQSLVSALKTKDLDLACQVLSTNWEKSLARFKIVSGITGTLKQGKPQ